MANAALCAAADGRPRPTRRVVRCVRCTVTSSVPRGGQAEAGAEVPGCLSDAGRFAVGQPANLVDRVGIGRSDHQAHSETGQQDEVPLMAETELGDLAHP